MSPAEVIRLCGRILLGLFLLLAGAAHLTFASQAFLAQVPAWVPLDPGFVVAASGVVELLLGVAVLSFRRYRLRVGIIVALFFVAVFPGNISQFVTETDSFGLNTQASRGIRLLFQPLLVAWALWSTGVIAAISARRKADAAAHPSLPTERARSRVSAYVYGNILVLAAIVALPAADAAHTTGLVVVAATAVTTFLAHILAHSLAAQIERTPEDAKLHVVQDSRDALPILSSAALPLLFLLLGTLTVLPIALAQIGASLAVILRLAGTSILVTHLSHRESSPLGVLLSGLGLAVISLLIVAAKVLLTH